LKCCNALAGFSKWHCGVINSNFNPSRTLHPILKGCTAIEPKTEDSWRAGGTQTQNDWPFAVCHFVGRRASEALGASTRQHTTKDRGQMNSRLVPVAARCLSLTFLRWNATISPIVGLSLD
jgi:hypothetical protein